MRYKEFLLQVAKDGAADKMEVVESESDTDSMRPGPTQTPCRPLGEPPGRLSGGIRKHVLENIMKSEECKRMYPARRCHVCATRKKRSEFCLVPLHKGECFQRHHTHKHY
jgi:hypothetical protein